MISQKLKHKFNAKIVKYDGIKFSSKLEGDFYCALKNFQDRQDIIFFLRQVPFHLPGNGKYVCDFQVFWDKDNEISFIDVKGFETHEFKTKKKIVEALYPITIDIVTKENWKDYLWEKKLTKI